MAGPGKDLERELAGNVPGRRLSPPGRLPTLSVRRSQARHGLGISFRPFCNHGAHGDSAELKHEEHDTIVLPKGTYRVRLQREFEDTSVGPSRWSDRLVCD